MNKKDKLGILIGVGAIAVSGAIVAVDYKTSKWRCRFCEEEFKAPFSEYFFAAHTPRRRRLTCPVCGNTGYFKCIRTNEETQKVDTETEIIIE